MSLAYVLAVVAATVEVHEIRGEVESSRTGEPLEGVLVVIECTCLDETRETTTDERGRYRVRGLPSGTYVVNVLRGQAHVVRVVKLGFAK